MPSQREIVGQVLWAIRVMVVEVTQLDQLAMISGSGDGRCQRAELQYIQLALND